MSIKDKISELLKVNKIDLRRDLLPAIEMTEAGYYAMFRNDSMKVSTLKKISDVLNVPVSVFLENTPIQVNEPAEPYGKKSKVVEIDKNELDKLKMEIEILRESVKSKDEQIDRYLDIITEAVKNTTAPIDKNKIQFEAKAVKAKK